MNRKIALALAVPLLLAGTYGGWHWWSVARFQETTDNAYVEADITMISPRVEGYVGVVEVVENQMVQAGDVLLRLDDRDLAAKADQARARRDAAAAAIANIDSRLTLSGALIRQADAGVAAAQAEQRRAGADAQRYSALARSEFASQQKLATTQADAQKAGAALIKAQAALTAERDQLSVLSTERAKAEAALEEANAALALAENDLEKSVIRAPIAGVVGSSGARVGQFVKAGTQLMALVPVQDAYITANFKETQIGRLRVGQPVELSIDAYPGIKVEGRIDSLSPASGAQFSLLPPENATGNFTKIVQRVPVRVALPKDGPLAGRLRPGLSVEVSVDTRNDGRDLIGIAKADTAIPQQVAVRP
ncbi:HlyD family secretion protein [Niveispirillum cyanobacteriorum]|uniref:Hemolysin D n=1 Tax=Niveispirillum cyanobacteriorum TaxID=1612173 RepID=A0A2K9NJ47_9PROT|nr:HlyD family secretion protein [Niveispirillum cyanobacteriorum]AUN33093.1 hemolysin D [Niveispirillum cyanobacteriorum]